jgi:predicted GIY-YIG superfamily endonuclease
MEVDPRYKKCKIYKIVSDKGVYIGHTTMLLRERRDGHNGSTNVCATKFLEKGFVLELIENYPCDNKKEACLREQHYMDLEPNLLNTFRASRPDKETEREIQKTRYAKQLKKNPNYFKDQYTKNRDSHLEKIPCDICGNLINRRGMTAHIKRMHEGRLCDHNTTGHKYIHRVGDDHYRYCRIKKGERHQVDGFKTIEEAVKYKDSLT